MYSGYVQVNATYNSNLFYWLMESQNDPKTDPTILWLTGGPGCSSELAVLFENGAFNVAPNSTSLTLNPYSWNKIANVLYVDSPVGTGFSYTDNDNGYATDEKQVADQMYTLLQAVMTEYPYLNQGQEFFVFGESYAGHYVPAVSERILMGNKKREGVSINMQGLSIGNGMTFPRTQYSEYADFSLSHGIISMAVKEEVDMIYSQCEQLLQSSDPRGTNASNVCNSILDIIQTAAGNINVYDLSKSCVADLCYQGITDVANYLSQPSVLKALNVAPNFTKWESCNTEVYNKIATPDWFNQEEYTIPVLLDAYRVQIYAGKMDWICNHQGNYKWVSQMDWNGKGEFNAAQRKVWSDVTGKEVKGYQQAYDNLSFVWVNDAGHMVPHDQPANALEMVSHFINNKPLQNPPPPKKK